MVRPLRRAATAGAGLEDRELPAFATSSFQRWWHGRRPQHQGYRGTVLLWPDTFTNYLHPEVSRAAVRVLESAGWTVRVPTESLCCGLTWISTGQLRTARRRLRRTVGALAPHVRAGGLVVGLEPSCTQIHDLDSGGHEAQHLAELLAQLLPPS